MLELKNKLEVVFISQPSFPNAGLNGAKSEHYNCITKPLPTHNLRVVSTHKPKNVVARLVITLLCSLSLSYSFIALPLLSLFYDLLLFPFLNFKFPIYLSAAGRTLNQ